MFCMLKMKKYILLILQNITQIVKKKQIILLMIPNGKGWHYLTVKKIAALLRGITSNIPVTFIA